jgi:hypothetical protein
LYGAVRAAQCGGCGHDSQFVFEDSMLLDRRSARGFGIMKRA